MKHHDLIGTSDKAEGPSAVGLTPSHRSIGQVVPVMAGVIVLVATLGLGVAKVATDATARARVQNGADAAALAAVGRPDRGLANQAAASIAHHNGTELVDFHTVGTIVVVTVRLGTHRATAAARAQGP